MNEITTTRTNALVDPGLHIWHGEIPIYLFLGGLVGGLMVLCGLWLLRRPSGERTRALTLLPWMAPLLLSVGMLFLWLDLENRFNAFRFYLVLRPSSPMSWGAWILVLIYPVSILLAWAALPEESREQWARRLHLPDGLLRLGDWALERVPTLAAASIVMGAGLGIYTGVLLGTLAAHPLWNSAILGPLFLTSGLSTGAAFMLLYRLRDRDRILLSRIDMGLILTELALLGLWLTGLATGGAAAREAAALFLGGPYTAAFWSLVVVLGLLAPLVGEWLEHRHGVVPGRAAALLVLVGGLVLRWILVYAGQYSGWAAPVVMR